MNRTNSTGRDDHELLDNIRASRIGSKRTAGGANRRPRFSSRKNAGRRLLVIGGVAIILLVGALIAGTLPRLRQRRRSTPPLLRVASALPRVTVAVAKKVAPTPSGCFPAPRCR